MQKKQSLAPVARCFSGRATCLILMLMVSGCRNREGIDSSLRASLIGATTCALNGEPATGSETFKLETKLTNLSKPVKYLFLANPNPSTAEARFVVEQRGTLKVFTSAQPAGKIILDLRTIVSNPDEINEGGLLGMALHPNFAQNRRFFLNFTKGAPLKTRVSEFTMAEDFSVNMASQKILFELAQPYQNHNGGELVFGPDGYLYIGMGDGGSGGDPQGNAQNLNVLLGKMLRIDVDHGAPYGIPNDNPFVGQAGKRPEIYAYGLRNPWRFSFDKVTGLLWVADVGQNALEEIDIVKKGKNYGWNIKEGTSCYRANRRCSTLVSEAPIAEYNRGLGQSVTGGFVYRGREIPSLVGTYLYADYVTGTIWGLKYENSAVVSQKTILDTSLSISGFGQDLAGEIYVIDHLGKILQLKLSQALDAAAFPMTVSATNCFTSNSPLTPKTDLVPYEVNHPLWSDGAEKTRFAYFPPGTKVQASTHSPWTFPTGSVFIKNFYLPQLTANNTVRNRIIETRFLAVKESWVKGYTYKWNEQQTEATYQPTSSRQTFTIHEGTQDETFSYFFPATSDCERCHTDSKGQVLGFSTGQLNKVINGQNQLSRFTTSPWLDTTRLSPDTTAWDKLADARDLTQTVTKRARSYLEVQCSSCHNPGNGAGRAQIDLNYSTKFAEMRLCNTVPQGETLGRANPLLLAPGVPENSILYLRHASVDPQVLMPPLGRSRVDKVGVNLMHEWISAIAGCQ
jgi:uncharacterized repeat protein (TIGR03806 family)